MSLAAGSEALRVAIEAELVDVGRFTRVSGEPTTSQETGAVTYPAAAVIYEGPCLVDQMSARARDLAGFDAEVDAYDVVLPIGAVGIRKGDVFILTQSRDSSLIGVEFQVVSSFGGGSLAPSRRVGVVRVEQAGRTAAD